jgi:hypothetical protein
MQVVLAMSPFPCPFRPSLRRALVLLALVVASLQATSAWADGKDDLQQGLLTQIGRAKLVPFDKSALKGHYPRASIAAGAVEKIVNKVVETDGKSLGFMLTESAQPSSVTGNPYVDATKGRHGRSSPEAELAKVILASRTPMMPGDVLGAALKITKGDYWLATLVCHNLLKEVTYAERDKRQAVVGWNAKSPGRANLWILIDPGTLTAKLPNLRPPGDPQEADKMGPWYHMFGLFFIGGMTTGTEAEELAWIENFTRELGLGSTTDQFKMDMNTWAAHLTHAMNALVDKNLQIPDRRDAKALTKPELIAKIDALKAEHKRMQADLERLAPSVNDEHHGPLAEQQMTTLRAQQRTIYQEVLRLQRELAARP